VHELHFLHRGWDHVGGVGNAGDFTGEDHDLTECARHCCAHENSFEKSSGKSGFIKIRSFLSGILSSSASGDGNHTGAKDQPGGLRQA